MTFAIPVTTTPTEGGAVAPELSIRPWDVGDVSVVDTLSRRLGGTLFHRSAWMNCVDQIFSHRQASLVAWRGLEPVGLLPMMRCRSLRGGEHLISSPYGVYGGPLGKDEGIVAALLDEGLERARALGVGRLELRSAVPIEHAGFTTSDSYVTFAKDLPETADEILKGMKKDERRLVRRAADTHGCRLEEGPWFVADLSRLFHASKQRLGSPGLPASWFRALLNELGPEAVVHIVRRADEVLAASMCFIDGDELRMYYIGTTEMANREVAVTSFMIAELQKWALHKGLKRFDLGRSRSDAGAVKFKRNQGFEPRPLHYAYGLVRSKSLPSFTPSNPRTAWLRKTWAKMPPWACVRLSRRLMRYFP